MHSSNASPHQPQNTKIPIPRTWSSNVSQLSDSTPRMSRFWLAQMETPDNVKSSWGLGQALWHRLRFHCTHTAATAYSVTVPPITSPSHTQWQIPYKPPNQTLPHLFTSTLSRLDHTHPTSSSKTFTDLTLFFIYVLYLLTLKTATLRDWGGFPFPSSLYLTWHLGRIKYGSVGY